MSHRFRLIVASSLLAFATGCGGSSDEETESKPPSEDWTSFGSNASNSRAALGEKTISAANVSQLRKLWSDTGNTAIGEGVTSTPAVIGDTVYWGTWNGRFKAFTSDGAELWTKEYSVDGGYPPQITTSPLVVGDMVYLTAGVGELLAVDRLSGDLIWRKQHHTNGGWMLGSPALAEDVIVYGVASGQVFSGEEPTFRGAVIGVDRHTGDLRWNLDVTSFEGQQYGVGISVWSSAAIDTKRKLAFIGTGQSWRSPASPLSSALIAINYETGDLVWYSQFTENDVWHITQSAGPDHDVGSTPNLFTADGQDMVGVGDKSGSYFALPRDCSGSCTPLWQTPLGRGGRLGGVMSASAYHDGVIYVSNNNYDVSMNFKDPQNKSHVYALNAANGDEIWRAIVDGPTVGGLTWANDLLFVPTTDGAIHALDAQNQGAELWSAKVDDMVGGGVSVSRGRLYFGQGFLNIVGFGSSLEATPALHAFGL